MKNKKQYLSVLPKETRKLNDLITAVFTLSENGEEWREIQSEDIADGKKEITVRAELQGLYFISNKGRLLSLCRNKPIIRKITKHKGKYARTDIDNKTLFIHRIVADYFIGNIKGKEIHHKNGNTLDNRAENLEILTRQQHSQKHQKEKEVLNDANCPKPKNNNNKQSAKR